jgi:hypothetical protein
LFEGAGNNPGEKTLEDKFFEHEVCIVERKIWSCADIFLDLSGAFERDGLPAAVPFWSVLLILEAEGTGVPQRRVDRRMCRPKTPHKNRQLHSHLLNVPGTHIPD